MRASIAFLTLLLIQLSFCSTHSGDGTYNLAVGDTVSAGGFIVELTDIQSGYDQNQNLVPQSASYRVTRSGDTVDEPTLELNGHSTSSADDGKRNITVKLVGFGTNTDPQTQSTTDYARTKISSALFSPPKLHITSVTISPDEFSANVSWQTDMPAESTLALFGPGSSAPILNISRASDSANSLTLGNLTSNTSYRLVIGACNVTCASEERTFMTLALLPEITNVRAVNITNDSAVAVWDTDVDSDSKVYYRKSGAGAWIQLPPPGKYDSITIHKYFDTGVETKTASATSPSAPSSAGSPATSMATTPSAISGYKIGSDMGMIREPGLSALIIRKRHAVKVPELSPETEYEFFVSSCAERCANSSAHKFTTLRSLKAPYAKIFLSSDSIYHGSSLTVTISAMSENPGGTLSSASLSWDDGGGTKSLAPRFGGDNLSFVPASYDSLSIVSITFREPGIHTLTLEVTDSLGLSTVTTEEVSVSDRGPCTGTSAKYYPQDTPCTNKWPNDPAGATIDESNEIGACHAFEVCDDSIDYMLEDAETCCNGVLDFSPNPEQNYYPYDKEKACQIAIKDTVNRKPMTSLGAVSSMKMCKTAYLVRGIGSQAIYMKDYYMGEACCKDKASCTYPHFQAGPWPKSNIQFDALKCYYSKNIWGDKVAKDGWYNSDTDPGANNNAVLMMPTHSDVNRMNTGTCADYSQVVTTSLRKLGYKKNEILSMSAPGHMYNLVWLPGNSKYSFIDTTGNTAGDFFTGKGGTWGSDAGVIGHCDYREDGCTNDWGYWKCPPKDEIYGCS